MTLVDMQKKIAYVEDKGIRYYVQIVRILKDSYQLTKDRRYATPLGGNVRRRMLRVINRFGPMTGRSYS